MVTSQEEKEVLYEFYESLLGTTSVGYMSLDLQYFHRAGMDLSALDNLITEEEVWETIKARPMDRAQGPDGYTGRFYKACWPVIKADFKQRGNARGLGLLNAAFITLISYN